jgi:hypothetical protein
MVLLELYGERRKKYCELSSLLWGRMRMLNVEPFAYEALGHLI